MSGTDLEENSFRSASIADMTQVINAVSIPMYTVDSDCNVITANKAFGETVGMTPEDCRGRKCSSLFTSPDCSLTTCPAKRAMELKKFQSSETMAQFNGSIVPVTFDVTPIFDSGGEVSGAINLIKNRSVEQETETLIHAAVNGKLDTRVDVSRYEGAERKLFEGLNQLVDSLVSPMNVTMEYIGRISKGDIPQKITDNYKGDFNEVKNNLNHLIDIVNQRNADISLLIDAAVNGRLDSRADVSRYEGANGRMISGINLMLDSLVSPMNVTMEYIDRISKGDIPQKITDDYKGDFNEVKNNLNHLIDIVNQRNADISLLIDAAVNGKLDSRADVSRYEGANGRMISGINLMLDSLVSPMNVTMEYIDRISKGDIPQKITDDYKGDFNEVKNNLNHLIDIVNQRNADISLLIDAAVNGRLDSRADVSKYEGANGRMISGINLMLDSLVSPMNVTMEYIDRISKGDIPQKITDDYKGDFNEVKNNLNHLIDIVNQRNADISLLIDAAVNGRLDTRADVSRYEGSNGKMIAGINLMLDTVLVPMNEAMRVSHEYANCNFKARFNDDIAVKGDFLKFKQALNQISSNVSTTIGLVNNQSSEYSKCNFLSRIDDSAKISGDFLEIRDSLNNVGIQVSDAFGLVNHQITNLAANAQEAGADANEVALGSAHVAKNVQMVSMTAEQSAEAIGQILKAMEDLSAKVQEVASGTGSVSELAREANQLSRKGAEQAHKAEQGMDSITKSSAEVDSIIREINTEMDRIGKIISLITSLANQTNLLALNAAIEAARAGEAGRGFAVVASEVKSLALESRQSADSIAEMIGSLKKMSDQMGVAMSEANGEVMKGNAALKETLELFHGIAESVERISRSIDEVARASETQAAVVEEVTASVNEVNAGIRNMAAEATDAAAASQESSASVDQIAKVIGNVNGIVERVSAETAKFRI